MAETLIVSVGEVVWDRFPSGAVLGGAPLNVAYHLQARGLPVLAVSRLGDDELGTETLIRLKQLDLLTTGMQRDERWPTGEVVVHLGEDNEPHFEIARPAAWDFIELAPLLQAVGERDFHLVFGTLGQREEVSRQTIQALWPQARTLFYDVNLRPPFTPWEQVAGSLKVADVVKVNEDELRQVHDWCGGKGEGDEEMARYIMAHFAIELLAVTRGSKGAMLVRQGDEVAHHPGFTVAVADTVGSGDAFFSGVINGYLRGDELSAIVREANRLGSFVAGCSGATPAYED